MNKGIIAIVLVLCQLICSCSQVSPAYSFSRGNLANGILPVTLNEVDFNTKAIINITNVDVTLGDYAYNFYGIVVYYQTGVLYANYLLEVDRNTYQNYLLAIDTNTNQLLFKDKKINDGMVTIGLAIDQTNGDIHFLNHSSVFVKSLNEVDWCKWNVNSQLTTVIQSNAKKNETAFGSIVYSSVTESLYTSDEISRTVSIYTANTPVSIVPIDFPLNMLTINSKTGQLYGTSLDVVGPSLQIELIELQIDNSTSVTKHIVCSFLVNNGFGIPQNYNPSDFDYLSNTWASSFGVITQTLNVPLFLAVNVQTCEQNVINIDSTLGFGVIRFNSQSN